MRRQTHDPYRAGQRLAVPQLPDDLTVASNARLGVVAYVDRYPPKENAGAEWMLHGLLRHLVRRNHRVRVVTSCDDRYEFDGVDVWPERFLDVVADEADVLVGHLLWTKHVVTLAADRGLPLVYLLHNDMQVKHWSLAPHNVTLMVANSRWVAEAVAWPGRTVVVRPPVLLDDYAIDVEANPPAARPWITLVNPNPDKGAECFYGAAKLMPDHRFATVQGAYGTQLRPRGLSNVVQWPATPNMRDDVYSRTRVLCVPSRYESWGRVAVEAMAAGIPVVAHPTSGLVEALGDAALFRDRDDHRQWAATLRDLDDPDTYAHWSKLAVERAAHLDAMATTDLAVWESAIGLAGAVPSRP